MTLKALQLSVMLFYIYKVLKNLTDGIFYVKYIYNYLYYENHMTNKIKSQLEERMIEDIKSIALTEAIDQLTAKDAMIHPVFLQKEDNIHTILKKLKDEDTQTCIVVDKKNHFIWEISVEYIIKVFLNQVDKEPMIKYLNRWYKKSLLYKTAEEICNKHNHTVNLDTNINKVIKHIYQEWFNYIPVLDKEKKVIWVVTPSSLINLLKDY